MGEGLGGAGMRIKNHTPLPTPLVRQIIRLVRLPDTPKFNVYLHNTTKGAHGWACQYDTRSGDKHTGAIAIYIPTRSWHPRQPFGAFTWRPVSTFLARFKGMPEIPLYSPFEIFAYVAAHEVRHIWRYGNPRGRRYWGAQRTAHSERDPDCYGLHGLRVYRREGPTARYEGGRWWINGAGWKNVPAGPARRVQLQRAAVRERR